jgi:hypothetical protein
LLRTPRRQHLCMYVSILPAGWPWISGCSIEDQHVRPVSMRARGIRDLIVLHANVCLIAVLKSGHLSYSPIIAVPHNLERDMTRSTQGMHCTVGFEGVYQGLHQLYACHFFHCSPMAVSSPPAYAYTGGCS